MKLLQCMVAWNDDSAQIMVGPWPDETGWSSAYEMTGGACEYKMRDTSEYGRLFLLFCMFNTMVVRDNVPPLAAHRAFLAIDEYRERISPDMLGATGFKSPFGEMPEDQ